MKTWITYITAVLLGLASALIFAGDTLFETSCLIIMKALVNLGAIVMIPALIFSFTAGVASLKKDRLGGKSIGATVIWTVFTSMLLPVTASLVFLAFPAVFPVKQGGNQIAVLSLSALTHIRGQMHNSGFVTMAGLLPGILLLWVFGSAMKPDSDTIRPAYAVMNSFSEVMQRIMRAYTYIGYVFVYVASCCFFTTWITTDAMKTSRPYLLLLTGTASFMILIVLPLIFACLTLFRQNPYRVLAASVPSLTAGFLTGNSLFSAPMEMATARVNNGVQKRITSTSTPFMMLFSHGGTAAMASVTVLSLMGRYGVTITVDNMMLVALLTGFVSFISFSGTGLEAAVTAYFTVSMLGLDLQGGENAILLVLPLLNGLGIMIDNAIMALGNKYASVMTGTEAKISYGDWL